jgi:hypothetical protein
MTCLDEPFNQRKLPTAACWLAWLSLFVGSKPEYKRFTLFYFWLRYKYWENFNHQSSERDQWSGASI